MTQPFVEPKKRTPPPINADSQSMGDTLNINGPELDDTGKPKQKAISSFEQANGLSKRLYQRAKDTRIPTAAVIAEKYAGGTPFRSSDLRRAGQGWRNNFSTNFLASMVDRAKPQIVDPVKKADTITRSALPPEVIDSARKTRTFRTRMTQLIRSNHEFNDLLDHIAQENYLYGHNTVAWLDDHWFPTLFRYDEVFLPERSGQHAKRLQYFMVRQQMILQDFVELLQDKEAALDAGYDWEGCILAANEATGMKDGAYINALERQDRIREHAGSDSGLDVTIKTVDFFHLVVREYDGTVALWTTTERNGHPIRKVENLHDSMEDAAALFTLQSGNKKYYGSKGAGRMLANMHIAIERLRNTQLDKIQVAGLPIIRMEGNKISTFTATVRGPFLCIDKECEVSPESIQFDFAGYEAADEKLVTIAVSIAGAFIPPNIDDKGSSPTKIEAAQKAERELAIKEGVLGRSWAQFMDMISTMQRKICRPINLQEGMRVFLKKKDRTQSGIRVIEPKVYKWMQEALGDSEEMQQAESQQVSPIADQDCVQFIVALLEDGLSIQEIIMLALDPAAGTEQKQGDDEDAKKVQYLEARRGNPMYDQKILERLESEIVMGKDTAEEVLLRDKEDPNQEAAATRMQLLELSLMIGDGEQSPVAAFDLHKVHRKIVAQKLQELDPAITSAPTPEMVKAAGLMCEHYLTHLEQDVQTAPEMKLQEQQMITTVQMKLKGVSDQMKKLAEAAAKFHAKNGANGLPPSMQGAPIGTQPDGTLPGDQDRAKLDLDYAKHADSVTIEQQKLAHSAREQELEKERLQHQIQMDHVGAVSDANKAVADLAIRGAAQGQKDAQADLQKETTA